MNTPINIKIKNKINDSLSDSLREDIFQLYIEGGWWKVEDRKSILLIDDVIKNSFCFAGAFDQEKLIGMGRVISDGFSDAYIQDVIVTANYRGRGIGKMIINEIVRFLKENKISWIALIAQPGTSKFYSELGFKEMKDYTPMVL